MSSVNDILSCSDSDVLRIAVADDRASSFASAESVNLQAAVTLLEESLAHNPEDQRLAYWLALLHSRTEKREEGERLLECLVADSRKSEWTKRARLLKAISRASEARWSDVVETLAQADDELHSSPTGLQSRNLRLLALALLHSNRLDELLEIKADDFEVLCDQATGLIRAERYDEALVAINAAARVSQDFEVSHRIVVRLLCKVVYQYVRDGRWEIAARALRESLSLNVRLMKSVLSAREQANAMAVVCLLGGERATATSIWEQLQRLSQCEVQVTHALLVSSLSEALHHEASGNDEAALTPWQRVVRNGVLLLHNPAFWQNFREQRRQYYRCEADHQTASELCDFLAKMLRKWLPPNSSLGLALNWEIASAEAIRRLDGLPVTELPEERHVYGVHMLRQLGRTDSFGHFFSQLVGESSGSPHTIRFHKSLLKKADGASTFFALPSAEALNRHARYFSRFGAAQVLLDQGFPEQALDLLDQVCCEHCTSFRSDQNGGEEWWPRVCHQACEEFKQHNPGYLELENPSFRLWHDATELAVEAHLAVAGTALGIVPLDVDTIVSHWREALRLSLTDDERSRIERDIAGHVLALTQVMFEQRNFDDAINLMEGACSVCRPAARAELEACLAEILNSRGVALAQQTGPDWKGALRDFSRSLELNRYVPVRLHNMIHALRARAREVHLLDSRAAAHFLLRAKDVLTDGLKRFTQEREFSELMQRLTGDLEQLSDILKQDSILKAGLGDYQGELADLRLACELVASEADQASLHIKLVEEEKKPFPESPAVSEPRIKVLDAGAPGLTPPTEGATAGRIKVLKSAGESEEG